ncbi:hypothetical protein GS436_09230 [Rhodococcus hoagii]|nr:hypothetical protein [Prescottella equi]
MKCNGAISGGADQMSAAAAPMRLPLGDATTTVTATEPSSPDHTAADEHDDLDDGDYERSVDDTNDDHDESVHDHDDPYYESVRHILERRDE